jgi:integrase
MCRLGSAWQDHGLVFTTGSPLNISTLTYKHFKPALDRAKLPKAIRLYDLRHSCATLLLQAGENPKIVGERLGHVSITLTLDVYSHVLPDMQKAAAEKLENILFRKAGTQDGNGQHVGCPQTIDSKVAPGWIRTNNQQIMSLLL